jgi:hypothetical protein
MAKVTVTLYMDEGDKEVLQKLAPNYLTTVTKVTQNVTYESNDWHKGYIEDKVTLVKIWSIMELSR